VTGPCELCGRHTTLTRHHLIPKMRHRNKRVRKMHDAEARAEVAMICRACHDNLHAHLTHKELERDYRSLDAIRAHPEVAKFSAWLSTKPDDFKPSVKSPK
jgi:5-methylcytosine-specific restriction endonuclease McrA